MIRTLAFATAIAAGFSMSALAEESDAAVTAAHASELANGALAKQAQLVLAQKGYVNVAISGRDDDGRFTGTAFKDGKAVWVAVQLPKHETPATN